MVIGTIAGMQGGAGFAGIETGDGDGWKSIRECDAHVVDICVGLERNAGRELISHWIGLDNSA